MSKWCFSRVLWSPAAINVFAGCGLIFQEELGKIRRQAIRYSAVGVVNVAIDIVLLNLGLRVTGASRGFPVLAIASVSFLCALANGYYWNTRWTFRARLQPKRHWLPYLVINLLGLVINDCIMALILNKNTLWIGQAVWMHIDESKAVAILFSSAWNFLALRRFVFGSQMRETSTCTGVTDALRAMDSPSFTPITSPSPEKIGGR
ncbi:MAG: GtrA family protein [Firmicutes bacterium]|nr:GtrA family protein [Bacillota bacterium]